MTPTDRKIIAFIKTNGKTTRKEISNVISEIKDGTLLDRLNILTKSGEISKLGCRAKAVYFDKEISLIELYNRGKLI